MTADQQFGTSITEMLDQAFGLQKKAYIADPMPPMAQRLAWLAALRDMLLNNKQSIVEAINQDFGNRAANETIMAEILPCIKNVDYLRRNLKKWMRPSKRAVGSLFKPASAKVVYQPLGVVGVIVPWNYPLSLAIVPLATALAAGNRVMIKMSERSPNLASLLKRELAGLFPESLVHVTAGRPGTGTAFAKLPFDHILFTGSTEVGVQVMSSAAANLTPVTLELGGKSPAIVSPSVPVAHAAERIAYGKALNAGQTCIAPDYALVPNNRIDEFVEQYKSAVERFYPSMDGNPDYTSIIADREIDRLSAYLDDAKSKGAHFIKVHAYSQGKRFPHTLLLRPSDTMKVMQDEIFGPILPIVGYDTLEQAIEYVNARPRPLALYFFGYDSAEQERVLYATHSGGVCINETLMHIAQEDLPFGGVGPSGMGRYHGHEGFLTFSNAKGVFVRGRFNGSKPAYPPYGSKTQKVIQWLHVR